MFITLIKKTIQVAVWATKLLIHIAHYYERKEQLNLNTRHSSTWKMTSATYLSINWLVHSSLTAQHVSFTLYGWFTIACVSAIILAFPVSTLMDISMGFPITDPGTNHGHVVSANFTSWQILYKAFIMQRWMYTLPYMYTLHVPVWLKKTPDEAK